MPSRCRSRRSSACSSIPRSSSFRLGSPARPTAKSAASSSHTNARGVLLLTIFGALGSWLPSPALITLCAATRWARGAPGPALPLLILVVGVLANWWWVEWWGNGCREIAHPPALASNRRSGHALDICPSSGGSVPARGCDRRLSPASLREALRPTSVITSTAWTSLRRRIPHGGVLTACLPVELILVAALRAMHRPLALLMPEPHRGALLSLPRAPALASFAAIFRVSLSVALGALTHVVWDLFTHRCGYVVLHAQFLRRPVFHAIGEEFIPSTFSSTRARCWA